MSDNDEQGNELLKIVRASDLDRVFGQDQDFLLQRIEQFGQAYARHMAGAPVDEMPASVTVGDLIEEHGRNPHRVQTLLQAMAFVCSPEMLAMLWMVLLGARLEAVRYEYQREKKSHLEVVVLLPDLRTKRTFTSDEHWDAAILKLAALSKSNDLPIIESFYPLFVPRSAATGA
jgi:hypothetical protein